MSKFKEGDRVRKVTGYPFDGTVCAVYPNEEKCIVKHRDKWEHIFADKQLDYYYPEYQYLDLLRDCLENGVYREGRNGGTFGLFGRQIRFDLSQGFPLLTTKKMHTKSIIGELLWFISGDTNIGYLKENGIRIWDEWADENGDLGPVYGKQWRNFNGVDQLRNVIEGIKNDPYGRRHIVTAWNPTDIPNMALPPCHCMFQFFVQDGKLSCQLYQRSADIFLGVPFNIASYALLTHLVSLECQLEVGDFVHTFGDVHLYKNHVTQADTQLSRNPLPFPELIIHNFTDDIYNYEISDFDFYNYQCHPAIKAEVSV